MVTQGGGELGGVAALLAVVRCGPGSRAGPVRVADAGARDRSYPISQPPSGRVFEEARIGYRDRRREVRQERALSERAGQRGCGVGAGAAGAVSRFCPDVDFGCRSGCFVIAGQSVPDLLDEG